MEEKLISPDSAQGTTGASSSLDSLDANSPISSYSGDSKNYPLETLEVRTEGSPSSPSPSSAKKTSHIGTSMMPFSRRKATFISLCITLVVVLATAVTIAQIVRRNTADLNNVARNVPRQGVNLGVEASTDGQFDIQGPGLSVVVGADIITRGEIRVASGSSLTSIRADGSGGNATITLPGESGSLCLDTNNCNFADQGQIAQLQNQVTQIGQSGVQSVNGQAGPLVIQGSTNRIAVTTTNNVVTITTPQDLHATANVQFGNLTLAQGGQLVANTLRRTTAGNNITIDAMGDSVVIIDGNRTFHLPTGGPSTQELCTDIGNCGAGGGSVSSVNFMTGALTIQGTPNQVLVTSAADIITLSTPQDIAVTSSPQFHNLTLTGSLTVNTDTLVVDAVNDWVRIGGPVAANAVKFGVQGSLFVTGQHGGGDNVTDIPPNTTRMYFDVNRSAFRAGSTMNNGEATVGSYSAAFGWGALATGTGSFAGGLSTSATNTYAFAYGFDSHSSGISSFTLGTGLDARAAYSTVMGRCAVTSGQSTGTWIDTNQLFVLGNNGAPMVDSDCSSRSNALEILKNGHTTMNGSLLVQQTSTSDTGITVTGSGIRMFFDVNKGAFRAGGVTNHYWDDNVVGSRSAAFNSSTIASGTASSAFGHNSQATGNYSFATGIYTRASGNRTFVAGEDTVAQARSSAVFGRCNVVQGSQTTWVDTDQLFVIGNGERTGDSPNSCVTHANALEVLKNGNTTIAGTLEVQDIARIGNSVDMTNQAALQVAHTFDSSVDCNGLCAGIVSVVNIDDAANAQHAITMGGLLTVGGSSVVNQAVGLFVSNPQVTGSASIDANYGIYIQNQTAGASNYGLYIEGADTYALWVDSGMTRLDGDLAVDTNTLFVDSTNHRVGIGTLTPANALDVVGSASISDRLQVGHHGVPIGTCLGLPSYPCNVALSVSNTTAETVQPTMGAKVAAAIVSPGINTADNFGADVSLSVLGLEFTGQNTGLRVRVNASTTTGVSSRVVGVESGISVAGGSINAASALRAGVLVGGAGSVGLAHGLLIESNTGSITDNIGIGIQNQTAGVNNYGLYIQGASTYALWVDDGATRLDGTLEVGTLSVANTNALLCRNSFNRLAACAGGVGMGDIIQGGNSFGAAMTIGTNDAYGLQLQTNGVTRLSVDTSGNAMLTGNLTVQGAGTSSFSGDLAINTNTLYVDTANGRIGIGTATPTSTLQVMSTDSQAIQIQGAATDSVGLSLNNTDTGAINWQFQSVGSASTLGPDEYGDTLESGSLVVRSSTAGTWNALVVTQFGSVGIGVNRPSARLHVLGTGLIDAQTPGVPTGDLFAINSNLGPNGPNANALQITTGWTSRFVVRALSGNVGINNGAPDNKLSLNTLIAADSTAQLAVGTAGTTHKGILVQGVNGQAADLFQAQDYTGAVLARITASGDLVVVNATINGTLTVNGNAIINGHVISGNSSGSTTVAAGTAADCTTAGSVVISGNDTAGRVTIDTGSGGCAPGVLATVTFANAFGAAPRVTLTPANADGAALSYYNGAVTTTSFTIDTASAAADSTTYIYTYHVIQ